MTVSNLAGILKMTSTDISPKTPNNWPDEWYYGYGVNPFGRNGKVPITKYSQYRNLITEDQFNEWKNEGKYKHNICVMVGRLSGHTEILRYARKGLYLNFADFDNELVIRELCNYKGTQFTLEEFAKICFVVQHADDKSHCHVYWISSKPMPKRTIDKDKKILKQIRNNQLPSVEIKGQGDVAFCPGGYHESGNPYLPIGTTEICIIEELGEHIASICRNYKLPVSDSERNKLRRLNPIAKSKSKGKLTDFDSEDDEEWSDIFESARNNTLFDRARKYYRKNKHRLTPQGFRILVHSRNQQYCKPPLPQFEVDSICTSILNHNNGGHE